MEWLKKFLATGTTRRWGVGIATILALALNNVLGLGIDQPTQMAMSGFAITLILSSNWAAAKRGTAMMDEDTTVDGIPSGTLRRWLLSAATIALVTLNRRLGLELDAAAQGQIVAVAGALVLGSNYKEGKLVEAAALE